MTMVRSGDAELYYEVHGSGAAIVFAHGAGGNAAIWYQQVPHFAGRYRVVTFDHRGFGRSTTPADQLSSDAFAADLLAILDDAAIDRAVIVAQSMGGWTAVSTALAAPERVAGVVLANTPGPARSPEIEAAMKAVRDRARDTAAVATAALAPGLAERDPAKAFLYAQISGFNRPIDLATLLARTEPAGIDELKVPIRMVVTDQDELFPAAALRSVSARYRADVIEITGAGHSAYFEKPDEFNAAVDEFLTTIGW